MVIPPSLERRDPEPAPPPPAPERRPGLTPVSLLAVLIVAYVILQVQVVLILTLLAIIFATVIESPLRWLERQRVPRGVGILVIYGAIVGALVLLGVAIAPQIGDQVDEFRDEAPDRLRELQADWRRSSNPFLDPAGADLLGRVIDAIEEPPAPEQEQAIEVITGVGAGIVGVLAVFAIAFYYLMEKALLRRLVLQELRPEARARVSRIWDVAEAKVGDWLRGQLTLCLIIGATATIGYGILEVRFWPLLGLWAGLTEIIPIVGPWIGGVPAVLIALTMSWEKAILVIGFIVLLQFAENTILVPRVMKGAVGLTPLTVFVAILAGTQFYGPIGAILAIPVAALIQILLTEYLDVRRGVHRTSPLPLPGWRWMRGPLSTTGAAPAPIDPAELGRPSQPLTPRPEESRPPASPAQPPPPQSADFTPAGPFGARGWTTDLLARAAGPLSGTGRPAAGAEPPAAPTKSPEPGSGE